MRGPVDMLSALLGNESTVYVLEDHPEECHELLQVCTEAFIEVAVAQRNLIPPLQDGYCSAFGLWSPGTVVRTQCDASALIGARWYESHILPFDQQICEAFDYSVIHLHSGYLFTVDALLAIERPTAIQISIDPLEFGPPPLSLLPVFRKILDRKPLLIQGRLTTREFDTLLRELPGEGLYIGAALAAEDDTLSG
jgi:hypothetical protein